MDTAIEPITSSADGKRNGYTLFCDAKGQRMNYAACLWRQKVLDNPATKIPEDWQSCRTAACSGKCNANEMRQEEVLAGKSLYFVCRDTFRKLADVAKEWGVHFGSKPSVPAKQSIVTEPVVREVKFVPVRREEPASVLDALGSTSSLADAITAAAKDQAAPTKEPVATKKVIEVVSRFDLDSLTVNETPLQMARRLNAMKKA